MSFKRFLAVFVIGVTISVGFVFFLKLKSREFTYDLSSANKALPPVVPRGVEIPEEIRNKFSEVPQKPTLYATIEHGSPIDSVFFSPSDPTLIVSRGRDKSIKLWNINYTSEPIVVLKGDSISFSSDGKLLAICGLRNGTTLWDVETKQQFVSLSSSSREAVFSSDGKLIAESIIGGIQLWNLGLSTQPTKGRMLRTDGIVKDLAFSGDGKLLSAANRVSGKVDIWEINGTQAVNQANFNVKDDKDKWVESLRFSPDTQNPVLAIAANDKNIQLHTPSNWDVYTEISAGYVNDIAFSSDAKTLVSAGHNEIELWSVDNGERLLTIEGYSRWLNCVDISADDNFVAGAGNDGVIRIWDLSGNLYKEPTISSDVVKLIYFLPSDRAPQPDIPEKLDRLVQNVQEYYADEMERHGFGRKTFTVEKNTDGSTKVYLFEGRTTADYYFINTAKKVKKEIESYFDSSKNIHLIVADINNVLGNISSSIVSTSTTPYTIDYTEDVKGIRGGDIIMTANHNGISTELLSRHLGSTFGLGHDLRDPTHLMSYGRNPKQLSKGSAEWLNKSRLFNPNQTLYDVHTSIDKQSTLYGVMKIQVKDIDGIHQVRMYIKPTNDYPPPGYEFNPNPEINKINWERKHKGKDFVLYDYITLNGQDNATVEFNLPKFSMNLIRVQTIDGHGNIVDREMNLVDDKESSISKFIRSVFQG